MTTTTSINSIPPQIVIDPENKNLVDRVQAALIHPLSATFKSCLETLVRLATNVGGKARLYLDFAPLSFGFCVIRSDGTRWINGGVIFHGNHDGYGSGSAPTYSVCVSREEGWTIHT